MKIFITGSAGFIGSHLVSYLLKKKDIQVIGIDDFSSGNKNNVLRNKKLYGERYKFIEGNILKKELIENNLKEVDCIFNLAAQVSVIRSSQDPLNTHHINTTAFLELIELARKFNIKKFIYPSSCSVYGDSNNKVLKESSIKNPLSVYASTKFLNDLYASNFSQFEDYPKIIGLRLFNVFGSWQVSNTGYAAVIPIWISRLMNGLDPIIYGDGKSTRDFIHVYDVCNAFYKALNIQKSHLIYNIGYGDSITLIELFKTIDNLMSKELNILNRKINPIYKEPRIGEIKYSKADISLAKKDLDFQPSISIKDGIKEILKSQYKLKI